MNRTSTTCLTFDPPPCSTVESWLIDEELRHLGRVLQVPVPEGPAECAADEAAISLPSDQKLAVSERGVASIPPPVAAPRTTSIPASIGLWLGLMALSCGGVLLAWSYLADRPELQRPGFPALVTGAMGLLLYWASRMGRAR